MKAKAVSQQGFNTSELPHRGWLVSALKDFKH